MTSGRRRFTPALGSLPTRATPDAGISPFAGVGPMVPLDPPPILQGPLSTGLIESPVLLDTVGTPAVILLPGPADEWPGDLGGGGEW